MTRIELVDYHETVAVHTPDGGVDFGTQLKELEAAAAARRLKKAAEEAQKAAAAKAVAKTPQSQFWVQTRVLKDGRKIFSDRLYLTDAERVKYAKNLTLEVPPSAKIIDVFRLHFPSVIPGLDRVGTHNTPQEYCVTPCPRWRGCGPDSVHGFADPSGAIKTITLAEALVTCGRLYISNHHDYFRDKLRLAKFNCRREGQYLIYDPKAMDRWRKKHYKPLTARRLDQMTRIWESRLPKSFRLRSSEWKHKTLRAAAVRFMKTAALMMGVFDTHRMRRERAFQALRMIWLGDPGLHTKVLVEKGLGALAGWLRSYARGCRLRPTSPDGKAENDNLHSNLYGWDLDNKDFNYAERH